MVPADFDESLELIRRARGGDREALQEVLVRYRERLLARVRLMMGERARLVADSGDFLQEALVRVFERFDGANIADEKHFLRWLTSIARNKIRDSVRRPRERALESLSATLAGDGLPDAELASPASVAGRNERLHVLVEALEALDAPGRQIVELHAFEGLSFEVAANRLGLSKTTVRDRYHRALVALGRSVRA